MSHSGYNLLGNQISCFHRVALERVCLLIHGEYIISGLLYISMMNRVLVPQIQINSQMNESTGDYLITRHDNWLPSYQRLVKCVRIDQVCEHSNPTTTQGTFMF